jgi:hypothetical protein
MNFEQWFKATYPLIAFALADGTAGPNERWLVDIARKGFAAGYAAAKDEARTE